MYRKRPAAVVRSISGYKLNAKPMEMFPHDNVTFCSINEVEVLIVVFLINTRAHNQLYHRMYSSSRVCAGEYTGVSLV